MSVQTATFAYAWTLGTGAEYYDSRTDGGTSPYTRYVKITGSPSNEAANASQEVKLNHSSAQSYVLSGWAMANAVPDNETEASDAAQDTKKQFGLRAIITYSDNTKEYHYVPFDPDIKTWQFTSMTIVPEKINATISTITVVCAYEGNANVAYFDNLSLVCASAQSYTYDENGMPTFSESTGLNGQDVTYDDYNNIQSVSVTGEDGTNIHYSYTYDSTFHHRLTSSSNGIITQTLTHDGVGNVTGTTLKSATDTAAKVISTSSTYTSNGNLVSSVTDAAGNKTEYGYGKITVSGLASSCDTEEAFYKAFGMPSTITDAKGNQTKYVTDTFGRTRQIDAYGKNESDDTLEKYASLKYTYGKTLLYEIQRTTGTDEQKYHFLYDNFGNTTSIGLGGWNSAEQITLASYVYAAKNGLLTTQTYGNGDEVEFTYDILGRTKTATYKDENGNTDRVLTYVYTGDGQLYSIHDSSTGYTYLYTYDNIGRLIASCVKLNTTVLMSTRQEYNANNQLAAQHWTVGTTTYSETYGYNTTDGALTSYNNALGEAVTLNYDSLRRLSSVVGSKYTKSYTYKDVSAENTTTQVSNLAYSGFTNAPSFGYTYDALGNISTYTEDGTAYTYTYDAQNQLTKVTSGGTTLYEYTYDKAGNITSATSGATTHTYTYGNTVWRDLLTAYDGQSIAYEGQTISGNTVSGTLISGNPISYYNGTRWTFDWEEGRNLVTATSGSNTYTYTYDSNGIRTSKTINGVTHNYLYASGRLLRETYGNVTLDFLYDNSGYPYALIYKNGTAAAQTYYYITNLQGDVLEMITEEGVTVASYSYDPYGKVLSATGTMASINPMRYRGYYYDAETGLYYVSSRYYDPEIGRFINADDVDLLGANGDFASLNLFAYCGNNPVSRADSNGHFWNVVIGAVVGGLVSGVVSAVTSYVQTGSVDWGCVAINATVGALGGAIAATGLGPLTQAGLTAVVSGAGNYTEQVYTKGVDDVNKADVICSALVGGGTSLLGSAAGKLIGGKLEKAGTALLSKGKDKLLTGMVRESLGQSHSSLLRQGTKYVAQATKMINTYRGISSSVGSLIGGATGSGYNALKIGVLGW